MIPLPEIKDSPAVAAERVMCPLCGDAVEKLVYRWHYESEQEVLDKIREQNPTWSEHDGACSRCVDYYHVKLQQDEGLIPEAGPFFQIKSADDFLVIPTPVRLDADPKFTGKGVTICFIDSGFTLHPDLMQRRQRIKAMIDITAPSPRVTTTQAGMKRWVKSQRPAGIWHGTMTTSVCAGDGSLSRGLYKGIASDADLVLIKVMDKNDHISTGSIVKALQWVEKNYRKYNIRVVNMSLGDDLPTSFKESEIDRLAEKLIARGITIVAAVGNDTNASIKPPANAPHVIAIGGLDDENKLGAEVKQLYHSTFGKTVDDLSKPELIAPAIWIAAPIPEPTEAYEEAGALYELVKATDEDLIKELHGKIILTKLDKGLIHEANPSVIREAVVQRIQQCKYVSGRYQHVDGTSFAAPMVCSVIAQLLEANPALTPLQIREVLFSTAEKMAAYPVERQGFGGIHARKALLKVLHHELERTHPLSPFVNTRNNVISFFIYDHAATKISLVGSFNDWEKDVRLLKPGRNGLWQINIPMLGPGRYYYKFLVNGTEWREDIDNPYREADGLGGWNSVLEVSE